jgi:hypothetical protein
MNATSFGAEHWPTDAQSGQYGLRSTQATVGKRVGARDGTCVCVGDDVCGGDGAPVGDGDGTRLGVLVVGVADGPGVGISVGNRDGARVGM